MHDRRLTIRTLMAIAAACSALFAWVHSQGSWHYALIVASHSFIAWVLVFIAAFAIARGIGPFVGAPRGRATISRLIAGTLIASLYLEWAHHRAMDEYIHGLERTLPYPDPMINALERWFDARNPLPPGGFVKLHGEYHRVGFVLGLLILASMCVMGGLVGVLWNRPDDRDGGPDLS